MMKAKVLILEDQPKKIRCIESKIREKTFLLLATTIEEAEKIFRNNPDVAAIAVDACVPGNRPTTIPFVRKVRLTFSGPMIAISSSPDFRFELISAGCNHACRKDLLCEKIEEVLKL